MKKLENLIVIVASPLLLLHEGCHYLVARALGLEVRFGLTAVRVRNMPHDWRTIAFTLAPALFGYVVALIVFLLLLSMSISPFVILALSPLVIFWQIGCAYDYYDAYRSLRYDRWQHWRLSDD